MSALIRRPLQYHPDLGSYLRNIAHPTDRAIWLRAGCSTTELFCACPALHTDTSTPQEALWDTAKSLLTKLCPLNELEDLPFRGGLAGFAAYDNRPLTGTSLPPAYFGLYPHFIHINHQHGIAEEIVIPGFPEAARSWKTFLARLGQAPSSDRTPFRLLSRFASLTSEERYHSDFDKIQSYLQAGDCYQVNYAQAFHASCEGSTADAMEHLLEVSNPTYAAWICLPEGEVMSLSPELFLSVQKGRITTRPIKGTAPRSPDPVEDTKNAKALRHSIKNQAENLMIVDLLRHDISQHAETGSVKVEHLFEIESLPQVHHLVSHITANLKKSSQSIDLIRNCLPGGSITGAPKKRAMEIIEELEPTARSIYCGSIGFINPDGDCQFNIAIRTLLRSGDQIYAWAGGGIVADSNCNEEYQECFDKMGALMKALEGM